MTENPQRSAVPIFLLFLVALSSAFYFLIIKSGHISGGSGFGTGMMWCPGVAALLTCAFLGRDVKSFGWSWDTRYQWVCYLIPLAYSAIVYLGAWITHAAGFYNPIFVASMEANYHLGYLPPWATITLYAFFTATVGMIESCAGALGEEIGWRGFLVPELAERHGFTATALISGVVWALWRYPVILFSDYNSGGMTWYAMVCFSVTVIALSFVFAWMRLKSGSLWTGVFLHASHNIFVQGFFDPLTVERGRSRYITTEFGAGLTVASLLLAIYFWSRRAEVEPAPQS